MTVGNAKTGIERSGPYYVRLQINSATTTQKHIREFFSDLTIPEGGISIHGNFSFVVFDSEKDAAVALLKDSQLLDGNKVRISNAVLKDVQRARVKEARKKLVFGPPEQVTTLKQKKRIRPTKVKDCSEVVAPKRFCPDEIEYPIKNHVTSLIGVKADKLKFNNKAPIENGFRLHDDKVDIAETKLNMLIEPVPKHELCALDKVQKSSKNTSTIIENIDKNEVNLKDKKNAPESCFLKTFKSMKNDSRNVEENISVQGNVCRFLEEKISKNKKEISFMDDNHSAKVQLEGKVIGQAASSKKVRDVTNKFPTKKTIKPTSVLKMNLFKMSYEGTVF
ncbi:hypothetical protein JTE90_001154 [Oedothorax gibbosus]|uniref:RRM domain-containing protein n=1 Tax=Oedothorax gibbosus TaxID=931172 RepID=A0AAV6VIQ6_9ARAC|nr:hypothetical protein JTE90_001154 [Oedothorax gibbosus]